MKTRIFSTALCLSAGLLLLPGTSYACEAHKARADYYEKLRRAGGTATAMQHWQRQRNEHQARYQECLRSTPAIQRVTGQASTAPRTTQGEPLRRSQSQDSVVLERLRTCNYWIETHNQRPTRDNRTLRDAACADFAKAEREARQPAAPLAPNIRPLQACSKPGNLLDNEVKACMEGRLEPYWRGG